MDGTVTPSTMARHQRPSKAVAVDADDLRQVLDALDINAGGHSCETVAAADRLHAAIATTPAPGPTDGARFAAFPAPGTPRHRVLTAIWSSMPEGCTDQELEHELNLARPTPGNRRGELVAGGWVEDSGRRRATTKGKRAVVWVLTATAQARLPHRKGA